jgi:hypothetical protein
MEQTLFAKQYTILLGEEILEFFMASTGKINVGLLA